MTQRVLFCWEVGEGSGHVVPYLSLLQALRARGWEVAVAARNTAEVGARIKASGALLLQAPVCLSIFPELDRQSFSTTELLLQHGYGYVPVLDGKFSAWRGMMEMWRPDLVIGSGAPTAHLVAQSLGIADIAIGSGFNCPPALSPAPMIRPWQVGITERLAVSEDRALQTMNTVLGQHGFGKRRFAMDMYLNLPTLLCTLAELDHYGAHRGTGTSHYLGMLPQQNNVTNDKTKPAEIFAYLRYQASVEPLFAALAKRGAPTTVFMPNLTQAQYAKLTATYTQTAPTITFVMDAVDINRILQEAKLVISNAGHNLTLQTLLEGCPLLCLPTHWEQQTVAELTVKVGAAINISAHEQHPKFKRAIDQLLDNADYKTAALAFAERHANLNADATLQQAIAECERLVKTNAIKSKSQTPLMSVR
jgi:Glycosyltransferase family 28 C-terminal domain